MSIFPRHPDELGDDLERITLILDEPEESMGLTDWEAAFMDNLRERVIQYGAGTRISKKQHEIINRIEAKMAGDGDFDRDPRDDW
jgi:hypothetical protein